MIHTMLFFNTTSFASLWYMAMIIPLYTILPIITVYINKFPIESLKVPTLLVLAYGFVVPTINKYLLLFEAGWSLDFWFSYYKTITPFFIFILAGYYVWLGKMRKISNFGILAGFILSVLGTTLCQLYGYSQPYDLTMSYDSVGILCSSFLLFELFRRYSKKIQRFKNCIIYISQRAFGIYMIHIFIIEFIRKYIANYDVSHFAKVLLYWAGSIVFSLLIIRILENNRWCKKLLLIKD